MTKRYAKRICAIFICFLFVFFIADRILPDKLFSERENRYLQTAPDLSFDNLRNHRYTKDFEAWIADQFPLRDEWITLNTRYEQLIGKKQINGFCLCDGERLIEPFSAPKQKSLTRRTDAINAFCDSVDVPVTVGLIPSAAEIYGDRLPEGMPNDSQRELIDTVSGALSCNTVDILSSLEQQKSEALYYRTDHHWTSLGAFCGYRALCEAWGLPSPALSDYQRVTVSDSFYGTAYSSSGFTWIAPDSIERFVEAPAALSVVDYNSGTAAASSLYREERLDVKDKYTYFLGSNSSRIVISQPDSDKPTLLILRDSFTDSLAPFLLRDFGEIHLLDLRYFTESVSDYIKANQIDRVLILYSTENFSTDDKILLLE